VYPQLQAPLHVPPPQAATEPPPLGLLRADHEGEVAPPPAFERPSLPETVPAQGGEGSRSQGLPTPPSAPAAPSQVQHAPTLQPAPSRSAYPPPAPGHLGLDGFGQNSAKSLDEDEDDELERMAQREMDGDEVVDFSRRPLPPRPPVLDLTPRSTGPVGPGPRRATPPPAVAAAPAGARTRSVSRPKAPPAENASRRIEKRDFLVESILNDTGASRAITPRGAAKARALTPRGASTSRGPSPSNRRSRSQLPTRAAAEQQAHNGYAAPPPTSSKATTPRQLQQLHQATKGHASAYPSKDIMKQVNLIDAHSTKPGKPSLASLPQLGGHASKHQHPRVQNAADPLSSRAWRGRAAVSLYS